MHRCFNSALKLYILTLTIGRLHNYTAHIFNYWQSLKTLAETCRSDFCIKELWQVVSMMNLFMCVPYTEVVQY